MARAEPRGLMWLADFDVFASLDWGYSAPGCALFWVSLLDGHFHIAHEYKFQQTPVEQVAKEIQKRTKDLGIKRLRYLVADPACWQKTGHARGESIAETFSRYGLPMKRGDNDRLNGWQRVHDLLREAPDGRPWLTVDPSCAYLRRTLPAALQDDHDPEDVDTTGDDHALDALRYGAMSRPSPSMISKRDARGEIGKLMAEAMRGNQPAVLGADAVRRV